MEIKNKTFLVSGGASGLGAATVRALAKAGAQVIIADLNRAAGEALVTEVGAARARFVETNVTDETSVKNAVAAAITAFGALHGAINCAGIAAAQRTIDRTGTAHPLELFSRVIQVNLVGTFNVIRLAAAQMAKQPALPNGERGVIVNTASVAAYDGQIGQAAYSASKGGIVGMTLPVARDLAQLGIRVMTIAPGLFDTPLLAGLPEPARAALGAAVPFPQRLGRPEEYAQLALHIVENEMLNGEVIRLDGALRMAPK